MKLIEGNLQFDFTGAQRCFRFDDPHHGLQHCMSSVDFIIVFSDRVWFVEVKDPQNPKAAGHSNARQFIKKLTAGALISENLVPKARDSFLYQYAQQELNIATTPVDYLVLIAYDRLDAVLLLNLSDKLQKAIPTQGPQNRPWRQPFIRSAQVFNIESWNRILPFSVSRLPTP